MPQKHYIYLDYAASAPMRPEALAAERAYEAAPYAGANPNSLHTMGREAARALDGARADLVRILGGRFRPSDVTFCATGTEANNLALYALAEGARDHDRRRNKVVISAIEHDSEEEIGPALRDRGFEVSYVRPQRDGSVHAEDVAAQLDATCGLVSVMSANNETGVVQPVAQIAKAARAAGSTFHTDASQAFCKVPLDLSGADAVTIAAHKIGGPVGVAALVVRGRVPFRPQTFGGGQEGGRRPGTQDVRGALAFAAAAKAAADGLQDKRTHVASRAQRLYDTICAEGTGIVPTTTAVMDGGRLPGMVSVMVPGVDSESLVLQLDEAGFEVSAASACASGSLDPSHVLSAMGIPRDEALGSLRVSFDERVPEEDLEAFGQALLQVVQRLRRRG